MAVALHFSGNGKSQKNGMKKKLVRSHKLGRTAMCSVTFRMILRSIDGDGGTLPAFEMRSLARLQRMKQTNVLFRGITPASEQTRKNSMTPISALSVLYKVFVYKTKHLDIWIHMTGVQQS